MEKIKISPIAIAKLLDIDLDYVIFLITGVKASENQKQKDYEKLVKDIRKKYKNEMYDLESLPEFENKNAVSVDL